MLAVPGVRIVRGPDWAWGDQDGGEGFVGTVCEIGKLGSCSPDKTVVVQWDNGNRSNYRVGYVGKYDLRVIDNAQIGVRHFNIMCTGCNSQGIHGIRYKCTICYDVDLCYMCYHGDKHDLSHKFRRFDTSASLGIELPLRQGSRKCISKGIFVGANVVRGFDWCWNDQDGGDESPGKVLDIRGGDVDFRSVVNVEWVTGQINVYRLGQRGKCDIKLLLGEGFEPVSGGSYYPDHLPILGQFTEQQVVRREVKSSPSPFGIGDKVQVIVSVEQLKKMQQSHGGWNPRMVECIDKIGSVHRITDKGDIRVQYEGCNNRWTFNPAALHKVNSFAAGDVVTLMTDVEKAKELQKGHGEWIDIMRNSLGKLGKVLKVYSDGDLRVQIDGHAWTLNPQCVKIVPGSAAELANTMHANPSQRQDPTHHWALGGHPAQGEAASTGVDDQFVRAAAQGHLEIMQRLLQTTPHIPIDARSGGKTALQVAAHQGHIDVVKFLIQKEASVNARDNDGDTCLHYAAFGNQPQIVEILIKAGAQLDAANRSGCTALHVATHKNPAKCVEILLKAKANPNCVDLYYDTALHDAIGKDSYQAIEMLCAAPGVDFTLKNKRGFNVLHHAALKGKNLATIKLLQHARQLVDVKKDDGFAALHLAALNGHKDVVDTLIRAGQADIDLKNNRHQTALLLAVSQGHCGVIELLTNLGCNVNVVDDDGDTALHIVLMKRNNLNSVEISPNDSKGIFAIYQSINEMTENRLATAIACYLIKKGINLNLRNNKQQLALDLLDDENSQEFLKTFSSSTDGNIGSSVLNESESLDLNRMSLNNEEYNLNQNDPEPVRTVRRSRSRGGDKSSESGSTSQSNSPIYKNTQQEEHVSRKPAECHFCSELSEENVRLEPCNHKPACEDCSARMKKCLECGEFVQKRVTKDGRVIPPKSRQPSAERLRYLESKIAEIEESHACSICMERKRNVVFLCGHGTCQKCADTLKTCHMCRKTITKKIPIY